MIHDTIMREYDVYVYKTVSFFGKKNFLTFFC